MQAYKMSLYLFILNLVFGALINLQIFTMMSGTPTDPILIGYDQSIIDTANTWQNTTISGLDALDMIGFLGMFFQAILNATLLLPFFLMELRIPAWLALLITAPVWYTYLAAIIQMATGRIMPLFE